MNIAILDGYAVNPGDLSWDRFEELGQVVYYDRTEPAAVPERIADVDIAVSNKVVWTDEIFACAPRLQLVALTSTGYNVVDLEAARRHGVVVCNVPAYSTPDVAQMTFALLFELCMHAGSHSKSVLSGAWTKSQDFCFWNDSLIEVNGKTLGIVGMGSIGQAVARAALAFGMEVVFFNRSPRPECCASACRQVDLDELLSTSDVVSLHVPASPETEMMIGRDAIDRMKHGALLINTARGTLVDEEAVASALLSGKLGGFGADVVATEPMRADCPLLSAKDANIVVTPHIAWATTEARTRLLDAVVENIASFLAGKPRNVVS